MTAVTARDVLQRPPEARVEPGGTARRARTWLREHALSIVLLAALLAPITAIQASGMSSNPPRHDDEGTYVSQAYVFGREARLSHYTYWYDHPPAGWMKLAAYDRLTGATARAENSVSAQREAMVVVHLIASVLLYALSRRLGFARGWGLAAVALFSLSPLAINYHRMVFLDNLAVPWLLGALLLATTPGRRLFAYGGSAACFALSVLTKETMLLALPALVYLVWQHTDRANRRYAWTLFWSVLVLTGLLYPLFATLQGELLPGPDHVSLWDAIRFHLVDRDAEHPLAVMAAWRSLDEHLLVLGVLAAAAAVFQRRLRPFVALVGVFVAMMFRPGGYLPEPYVIVLLPFAALLVAGTFDAAWRCRLLRGNQHADPRWRQGLARAPAGLAVAGALALGVVLAEAWTSGIASATEERESYKSAAEAWVRENVSRDERLLIENTMWVDLVRAGFPEENVLWFYKLGLDPASVELYPEGFRDFDYIVGTSLIHHMAVILDVQELLEAFEQSSVVAAWGQGRDRVEVRRIEPDPLVDAGAGRAGTTDSHAHVTTGGTP